MHSRGHVQLPLAGPLWAVMAAVALVLATCGVGPTATSTPTPQRQPATLAPTPTPTATPASIPVDPQLACAGAEGYCRQLMEEAATVVLGRVASGPSDLGRVEPDATGASYTYHEWVVDVDEYLLNPRPSRRLTVRTFRSVLSPAAPEGIPMKQPALAQGERVLLVLDRRERPFDNYPAAPLTPDTFTIVGPISHPDGLGFGKFTVDDGWAQVWVFGPGVRPWEPLDQVVAAVKAIGAGVAPSVTPTLRFVATPTPSSHVTPGPTPTPRVMLTEAEAIERAVQLLRAPAPEVTGVEDPRDPVALLMTLGEYEARYSSGRSARGQGMLVWVVQVRGQSHAEGIVPPDKRQTYEYAVAVLDAATGQALSTGRVFAPVLTDGARPTLAPTLTPTPTPPPPPTRTPTPSPTPLPPDVTGPTPTRMPNGDTLYPPAITGLDPASARPGQEVAVHGRDGYIRTRDGGYIEGARSFGLFFDGAPIGSIGCYIIRCEGRFTVPADTKPGRHVVSVEGGASRVLEVLSP